MTHEAPLSLRRAADGQWRLLVDGTDISHAVVRVEIAVSRQVATAVLHLAVEPEIEGQFYLTPIGGSQMPKEPITTPMMVGAIHHTEDGGAYLVLNVQLAKDHDRIDDVKAIRLGQLVTVTIAP